MRRETYLQREAEQFMLAEPKIDNLQHWSRTYSYQPHPAGDLAHAESIRQLWGSYGIATKLVRYDVLQNFPLEASLRSYSSGGEVAFEATLTEVEVPEDPTSVPGNGLPAFHGFSANGDVQAPLVYANFGRLEDFELEQRGVSVKGSIVICKYTKIFRGLKVRAAERVGAVGVIMYNDPQEDGEFTIRKGHKPYPHGPARHPKSIQRGSLEFFSVAVGDPSTPGYPSRPGNGTERLGPKGAIPGIPSLPISYADALPWLKALNGRGLNPADLGADWAGELDEVEYCTGPSGDVRMVNRGRYEYAPVYNVIGTVPGTSEETIILGNHHDSWCCGAVDPVSGSAAMNEVARGLGLLLSSGWTPYRKIVLASWDNEEYGLVETTEWGEDNAEWLSENCVAYINVDESTNGGAVLGATGSPLLISTLRSVGTRVPSSTNSQATIYDDWLSDAQMVDSGVKEPQLAVMGTGSDYTIFVDHLGIPSLDLLFNRQSSVVYPYHSNYDSYTWLERFGDVGFEKHRAMARLWGVLAVRLAGTKIVPFKAADYAIAMCKDVEKFRDKDKLDMRCLQEAICNFGDAAARLDACATESIRATNQGINAEASLVAISQRYMKIERMFLAADGLPGRPWYRHIIYAPGLWMRYDGIAFPAVVECLAEDDLEGATRWIRRLSAALLKNAEMMSGETS
ncbi:Zn-dependent exopeptidase [Bimuria novae-zelandiae CBS 107.79]|uniref:Zn-dependent exopeptidase n=1 Tax=Bimuria novae-zelandiae CBS 107.79 TaxID=1447943 RepID=A0A6A5VH04_9PLEO|nr:Zn-dependent exopeptidase [Bimuria novae-zelandiae CBS 107.79]